jgi:CelD/BcsL family acetyltransferase involved in cellulose biosynthesis
VVAGDRVPERDLQAWAHIQEAEPSLGSPFFRPEFTQIVAAARADVAVAIVRQDEGEPAFFPFQRGPFARARPVGSRLSDYQGIVARGEQHFDAQALIRSCGLRSWAFDAVVADQAIFQPFHRREKISQCIDVTQGFEAFVAERAAAGSDQVADLRKQAERLEAEVGSVRFEVHVEDPASLEVLLRWKSEQYKRTGAVDIFSYPWVRDVARRVHGARHEGFAGLLSVLYVADEPIAAHLGLRSRTTWHYWLPAYDRRFAKHSPGLILLLQMTEAAVGFGLERIDLGKGDALYKRRLANASVPLAEGSIDASLVASLTSSASRVVRRAARRTPLARRIDLHDTRRLFA